ncbi:MAG TPA: tetratricopeptide repeat protein [Acidobacteriaceae bacterium]|nr:tetratricopeptide repeat protein [Acidobacteriaceae bacterium]
MTRRAPRLALALSLPLLFSLVSWGQTATLPPGTSSVDAAQPAAPANPLSSIESTIAAKNYAEAASFLDAYIAAHPTDARALFDRGYCADAQGQVGHAKLFYRKAIAADPKQFESRLALGLILANEGDPGARGQLQAAANLQPNPPNPAAKAQALRALAHLVRNTDPAVAKQALIDALRISPEAPDDALLAAEIADASGDPEVAEQAYRKVLNENPQSTQATAGLIHIYMQQKKYSDAEPLLKSALARDPDSPSLNAQYAALLGAEGRPEDAVTVLEKLHQIDPKDDNIARMLADGYAAAGQADKADALYAQLLAADPNNPELESDRGEVLIREGKYAEALVLLQKAAKVRQDDPDTWSGIAFAASKTGNPQLVLDALTMRSKYAAETPATYFLRATASDTLHHEDQAVHFYRLFLETASGQFPEEERQARRRVAELTESR